MGKRRGYARDNFLNLMRKHHLVVPPRRTRHTTNSNHLYFKYPNLAKDMNINHIKYSVQALEQAVVRAGGGNLCGTTHHSDRGVQYASDTYTTVLHDHNIRISMCEDYNPTDNGLAERVNGTIKTEWLYPLPLLKDLQEAQEQITHFVDLYNNVRPHRSLKNRTPMSVYLDDPNIVSAVRWHYEQAEKCAERAFF